MAWARECVVAALFVFAAVLLTASAVARVGARAGTLAATDPQRCLWAGESDPVKAVEDALVTFPAERVVLFSRPDSAPRHNESIDADALQQRVGLPVQRAD